MKSGTGLWLIAVAICGLLLVLTFRTKDFSFYFAFDIYPSECIGEYDEPVLSSQLRSGTAPPATWDRNERLERIIDQLKHATGPYPSLVSACTSKWRVLVGLGAAIAVLLLSAGLSLILRRRARSLSPDAAERP